LIWRCSARGVSIWPAGADRGVITQAEFDEKKKELLDRI
jgi:hypothetical protein